MFQNLIFHLKKRRQYEYDYLKGKGRKTGYNDCNGQSQCNRESQD